MISKEESGRELGAHNVDTSWIPIPHQRGPDAEINLRTGGPQVYAQDEKTQNKQIERTADAGAHLTRSAAGSAACGVCRRVLDRRDSTLLDIGEYRGILGLD